MSASLSVPVYFVAVGRHPHWRSYREKSLSLCGQHDVVAVTAPFLHAQYEEQTAISVHYVIALQ